MRCIISVSMLSEGWDATTVTHVVGLRPFGSQLLCEQVVGRALRRTSYAVDPETGLFQEETAKVFGVPFELIPFKVDASKAPIETPPANHIFAVSEKARYEIDFPLVESYVDPVSYTHLEGLGGQIQMIYIDPPYGVKFGSNFQPFVRKRKVTDADDDLSREPETVKAYRDTWELGLHSYLTYVRDRLLVARELLSDSGSEMCIRDRHHRADLLCR